MIVIIINLLLNSKAENEMLIGLFSVIAQSESENISANVKWGVQQRMKSGTYRTNFDCFGYRKGENGIPNIVPEEAEVVKIIYQQFGRCPSAFGTALSIVIVSRF